MTVLKILEVLAANQRPDMDRRELGKEMQKTGMYFGMNLAKLDVTEKGFTPKR